MGRCGGAAIWWSRDEGGLYLCQAWTGLGPYDGRSLAVTLQGMTIVLQFYILGTKVFVVLCYLAHTGTEALHLCLEIRLC
ncbi:unnamed protein product [Prunus armeniaca]